MFNENNQFKIAIIGAGPGGISAATHAAELGISYVLLESELAPAHTIRKFQRGKHVMAEPNHIPLRSSIPFTAGTREKILKSWEGELAQKKINIRLNSRVTAISGERGNFVIATADGKQLKVEIVVLAIGVQGNIRKLGVEGENLPMVQYQLDDPDAFVDETIVIVGGGDAGVENALALTAKNRVILINRDDEFTRCNETNLKLLNEAVEDFVIETRLSTRIEQVMPIKEGGFSLMLTARTPQGTEKIACHRVIARLGADPPRRLVESFGVRFPNEDRSTVPQLSAGFESNVPGLYIIGALAGYPLIKQVVNQGYEVIEHILGRAIEATDELLLKEKLSVLSQAGTSDEKIAHIRETVPLLAHLTLLQLRQFFLESSLMTPADGELVYQLNDYSTSFFTIISGMVTILAKDGGPDLALKTGEFFGEMGLISGRRRMETIYAGRQCVLVETPRRTMLNLIGSAEALKKVLDETALKRAAQSYIGLPLSEDDLNYLVQDVQQKSYAADEMLYTEGDKPDGLYLIRHGSVTVSHLVGGKEVVSSFVTAGNYVGEMELIADIPRACTVRAAVATDTVLLESSRIAEIIARNPALRSNLDARYLRQLSDPHAGGSIESSTLDTEIQASRHSRGLVSFLMRQGIGEATDVLLIDYSLCIRCDACETACADTHGGTSRLDREAGTTFANIHVPTSCRHCEHPHCMKDCPPDAIRRSVSGEVYINDSCIGCGNCVKNCPYEVIQMAAIQPGRKKPGLIEFLLNLATGRSSSPALLNPDTPKKAVKCDMCNDFREGPVCVRVCPTGAAKRVNPEQLLN